MTKPAFTNAYARMWDLVRYKRSDLLDDGLITREEYACLVAAEDDPGSPSARRLESYDEMRQRIKTLTAERDAAVERADGAGANAEALRAAYYEIEKLAWDRGRAYEQLEAEVAALRAQVRALRAALSLRLDESGRNARWVCPVCRQESSANGGADPAIEHEPGCAFVAEGEQP